jgi:N-acetyl-alpha-D-glucosaminyl L-malate synthase BshA
MKIAIVCYPVRGGSGVVASELGIGLSKRGCEVHFFSYELPFRLTTFESNFIFHEIDIMHYPLFKYPPYTETLAARLADESLRHRFDIIHAHYAIPHATAAYLAAKVLRNEAPKIITTLHGTDITLIGQDRSFYSITKFSIEESDGVTTVSNYLEEETRRVFSLKRDIRVISNFVDTERFQPGGATCGRNHFAQPDEKIIMHMSNYRPVKNAPQVVMAFNIIQKKIPSKLVLVGDGPDAGNVLNLAQELGLSNKVMFLGNQDRVQYILPMADLFLLPSASEAFGLAALEALSCGVPVVASKIGGLPEFIEDDVNGFLVPVNDIEAMAEKALKILTDDNLAKKLSAKGRQMAMDKYRTEDVIGKYMEYYEDVISGRNKKT